MCPEIDGPNESSSYHPHNSFQRRDMQQQSLIADVSPLQWKMKDQMQIDALVQALVEALVETQAQANAKVEAKALGLALVLARALARALALARARAETRARARVLVLARVLARVLAKMLARSTMLEPTAKIFTYEEILADSGLKKIIYSLKPCYRYCLARLLRRRSQEYWWLIQIVAPITRLPTEVLHHIFLIIIDEASGPPLVLMRVCKYWYTIVTGIWSSLKLGTTIPKVAVTKKLERNQWFLDILVDTESDRGHFIPSRGAYEAILAAIAASSRWRGFVVETFPAQADLPKHLVNHGLQQTSGTVMSRLGTFKIKSACETSPLLDHILRILGTTASAELTTIEIKSANVLSFLVPMHSSVFHSVKVLSLDAPGVPNPVDLLPHLHQLETLSISHLPLPVYHNDVNLPFVHTLRHLTLRSVSIQWMSGRTFHILESFTILFPLHRQVLHTFRTTLPNCKHLTFEGYPLDILEGVSAHNISHLAVISFCSNKSRGNRQLARFSSQALGENRLAPRILHIGIEATNKAWVQSLAFMSNLEELMIDNAQPSSLGAKVLQSLVVHPVHADNLDTSATPRGRNTVVCTSLRRFGLRYRRWLRSSESFDMIPDFVCILWSRQQSKSPLQSFRIWTTGDQKDPLELIEARRIHPKGFERLANECAIERGDLLRLMTSVLVGTMGVGQAEVREFLPSPPPLSLPRSGPPHLSSLPTADFILHTPVSSANNLLCTRLAREAPPIKHHPRRLLHPSIRHRPKAASTRLVLSCTTIQLPWWTSTAATRRSRWSPVAVQPHLGVRLSPRPLRLSGTPCGRSNAASDHLRARTLGSSARIATSMARAQTNYTITQVMSRVFSWFKWRRKESVPVR
jgi:hypothetical protein